MKFALKMRNDRNHSEMNMKSHLNKQAWQEWISKPEWTIAEAAALSVGIPPEAVEVVRHVIPREPISQDVWNWLHDKSPSQSDGDFYYADETSEVAPIPNQSNQPDVEYWTVGLKADQIKFGKTIEALLQRRIQDVILGGKLDGMSGTKLNPTIPQFTPGTIIQKMRYHEWDLPPEMTGSESITSSTQIAPNDSDTKNDAGPKDLDAYLASLGARIYIDEALILAGVKDPKTLKKRWVAGEIPRPHKATLAGRGGIWEWQKPHWQKFLQERKAELDEINFKNIRDAAKAKAEREKHQRQVKKIGNISQN